MTSLESAGVFITAFATVVTAITSILSFIYQRKREHANVIFFFKRKDNRLIPCISNTGKSTARDITIKTNPPLNVVGDLNKEYDGYERTYSLKLLNDVIHTLEVGQTIEDNPGFDVASFKRQFISYQAIYASASFLSADTGRKCKNEWHIDIAPLTISMQ